MALKPTTKGKITNLVYGLGASVVLIGALMKITHQDFGPITANLMLTVGLVTEAIIFAYSAFFDAPSADYSWENVYPELAIDGETPVIETNALKRQFKEDPSKAQATLSEKLDEMLKEAQLDKELFERLREGIGKFGSAVEDINKTTDATTATQKYGDQLALAANHMESLNALYSVQLENGKKSLELNNAYVDGLEKSANEAQEFVTEIQGLKANVQNLNKVYGGMLTAMKG